MIRVAICDDVPIELEIIVKNVKNEIENFFVDYEIQQYTSGEELLKAIEEVRYDLIVLDINMSGCSGFDVARHVFNITKCDNLMFVSSEENLVHQAISFRPIGFIRKSNIKEDTKDSVRRWFNRYGAMGNLTIEDQRYEGGVLKTDIPLSEIMYIEADSHYICIHCINREEKYRANLKGIEYILKYDCFAKVHRSYIYNIAYVKGKKMTELKLVNGDNVCVSRSFSKSFEEKYKEYIRKVGR